jgi:hypothetical protein
VAGQLRRAKRLHSGRHAAAAAAAAGAACRGRGRGWRREGCCEADSESEMERHHPLWCVYLAVLCLPARKR